jgi:hypothetical protein
VGDGVCDAAAAGEPAGLADGSGEATGVCDGCCAYENGINKTAEKSRTMALTERWEFTIDCSLN